MVHEDVVSGRDEGSYIHNGHVYDPLIGRAGPSSRAAGERERQIFIDAYIMEPWTILKPYPFPTSPQSPTQHPGRSSRSLTTLALCEVTPAATRIYVTWFSTYGSFLAAQSEARACALRILERENTPIALPDY